MNRVQETFKILEAAARKTPAVCVAFSGGKDSLCVLDLCVRTFPRVEAFFMYFVPGLSFIEKQLEYARQRYHVTIRQYPHWAVVGAMQSGAFCPNHYRYDLLEWKLHDVYSLAMFDSDTRLIATGAKRTDSLWRRKMLKSWGDRADVIYPCIGWNMFDILGYLKAQDIPLPDASGPVASGVDLATSELLFMYDHHPEDFAKIARCFPYIKAVVYRREWFGIGSYKSMNPALAGGTHG